MMEPNGGREPHQHTPEEWADLMARTAAHLAAQVTMTQLRLRALASELAERDLVDPGAVQGRLNGLAESETGRYLREHLGEALVDVVDVEALETDIIAYLRR